MDRNDDSKIASSFWIMCIGTVLGGTFLLGSVMLVVAAVKAANYDGASGVGESGVHDLLFGGSWVVAISLACLIAFSLWRVVAWRRRVRSTNRSNRVLG